MTKAGSPPPGQVERRATQRPSYAADRQRAIGISILVHGFVILLLVLGLPHLRRQAVLEPEKPIAISLVQSPAEPPPTPADSVSPAPASSAQAAPAPAPAEAQAQPPPAEAMPYDPSYNPFALEAPTETRESPQAPAAPQPTPQAAPQPASQPQSDDGEAGDGAPNGNGTAIGALPGNPMGDPKMHPQYLRIQLNGFVNAMLAPRLHQFLQRLIDCGVVPVPGQDPNLSVEADVGFAPTGTVSRATLTNQGAFGNDPTYQKAASELMNALAKPSCSFIQLPPRDYLVWQSVHLSFYMRVPGQ